VLRMRKIFKNITHTLTSLTSCTNTAFKNSIAVVKFFFAHKKTRLF
jgi:hypothetical protein